MCQSFSLFSLIQAIIETRHTHIIIIIITIRLICISKVFLPSLFYTYASIENLFIAVFSSEYSRFQNHFHKHISKMCDLWEWFVIRFAYDDKKSFRFKNDFQKSNVCSPHWHKQLWRYQLVNSCFRKCFSFPNSSISIEIECFQLLLSTVHQMNF